MVKKFENLGSYNFFFFTAPAISKTNKLIYVNRLRKKAEMASAILLNYPVTPRFILLISFIDKLVPGRTIKKTLHYNFIAKCVFSDVFIDFVINEFFYFYLTFASDRVGRNHIQENLLIRRHLIIKIHYTG